MNDLRKLQNEVNEWASIQFPDASPYQPLLGIAEETGELCHAHLKGEQGIRHTPLEVYHMKQDAVADILIYLANYCGLNNIDLQDAVEKTWDEVKLRNWQANASTGVASDTVDDIFSAPTPEALPMYAESNGCRIDFKPFGFTAHEQTKEGLPV